MRFAFTTQPITQTKDGKESIDLYVRNALQTGHTAPEVQISWTREAKGDWKAAGFSLSCGPTEFLSASGLARQLSKFLNKKDKVVELDDADALMVAIERAKGFQIVYDPRVKKCIPVEELSKAERGDLWCAKVDDVVIASCPAKDEDDARPVLSKMVHRVMEMDDEMVDLCAKWFKGKKKVTKQTAAQQAGAAPKVHPLEGYLKRSAGGIRKKAEKEAAKSA